ncbi:MAG: ester cyclase [Gammaproteobacteria bacterium]|nr:ester cyclase [Gammaproteobacteria bacterium]
MQSRADYQAAKQTVLEFHRDLLAASDPELAAVNGRFCTPEFVWNGSFPFNRLDGSDAVAANFWQPLKRAFPDLERRDDIFMAGQFEGGTFVASTGHLLGTFMRDWLDVPPTGKPKFLRYGEFHRVTDSGIAETFVIYDLIGFFRQLGLELMPASLGLEILTPGPATQDGLLIDSQDPAESQRSLQLVEDMIYVGLTGHDEADLPVDLLGKWWHPDMMWYGPSGIGTTRGITGFKKNHQIPMRMGLSERDAGHHKARFAEGSFTCSVGWPSYYAKHTGSGWMGLPPTGKAIGMRVMDWWRRDGDLLRENWVFIDLVDTFNQLGYDMLARMRELLRA